MDSKTETFFIEKCLRLAETRLGWGNSSDWTNQDFELLSEKILETTGVCLSITTLKRLWGKVKYESKPNLTTLNALAQFGGFESWRSFQQSEASLNGNEPHQEIKDHVPEIPTADKSFPIWVKGIAAVIVVTLVLFYFLSSWNYPAYSTGGHFRFTSAKVVSSGVPNSVIFDYDASSCLETDSIAIQQSWDARLSQPVSRDDHQHTSIYYYPGFFQAKLVVNRQVVKEHELLIQTDGWVPLVEQGPVPYYFTENDARHNGALGINIEQLEAHQIALQPETPWISYYNVRPFDQLMSDNFVFETSLKSTYGDGGAVCQQAKIILLTEGSAISIPLSIKGCASDLNLFFIDHEINGKKADLSSFGCKWDEWVNVRLEMKDHHGKFFINDQLAYDDSCQALPTGIAGIVFKFQGNGIVDYVRMQAPDGSIAFNDDF